MLCRLVGTVGAEQPVQPVAHVGRISVVNDCYSLNKRTGMHQRVAGQGGLGVWRASGSFEEH